MILQALLVSKDDATADSLSRVLAQLDVSVVRSSAADVAVARLSEERFDHVIVDFEDPETASLILESCRRLAGPDRNPPVTAALLTDAKQIRAILDNGAHFILIKPVAEKQALATLRAATAILARDRRQSQRVAVQVPVSVHVNEENTLEAIALDLSVGGMDMLAAKSVPAASLIKVKFDLPEDAGHVEADAEVAWSTDNGQMGLRFRDLDSGMREKLEAWLLAQIHDGLKEQALAPAECKLTDLSLGGCYVETESPFPQSSVVDLCLKAAEMEIHTEGMVRVMHPGYGMGVEFSARTEAQRKHVEDFIGCLAGQPGTEPHLEASPRSLNAGPDFARHDDTEGVSEDPLLDLLRTGTTMEQENFLEALRRQRTPAAVEQ